MSKSLRVFGYCVHMLVSTLVEGTLKFLFELLKFALFLLATFCVTIGIFRWWNQSEPSLHTNIGMDLLASSAVLNEKTSKNVLKKLESTTSPPTTSVSKAPEVAIAKNLICTCGKQLQGANANQNYLPISSIVMLQGNEVFQMKRNPLQILQTVNTSNIAVSQNQTSPRRTSQSSSPISQTVDLPIRTILAPQTSRLSENESIDWRSTLTQFSMLAPTSGPCDGPNITKIYTELDTNESHERRSENGPVSRKHATSGPCDGPNIARIYSDLYKRNAVDMRIHEMRQLGLSGSLLDKIKSANVTSASVVGSQAYNTLSLQLKTSSPSGSKASTLPTTSAHPSNFVEHKPRSSQAPAASNEGSSESPIKQVEPDRNTNQAESFLINQAENFASADTQNLVPIETNINTAAKEPNSTAKVCRCRNPKCKRRVQLN